MLLTVTLGDFAGVVEDVPVVAGAVRLGLGDSECADEAVRVPDVVPAPLLKAVEELPVAVWSAWAIPDPLASAAPIPRVSAPAPSQV